LPQLLARILPKLKNYSLIPYAGGFWRITRALIARALENTSTDKNMPNWCENNLIITGDKKTIASFKKKAAVVAKDNTTDLSLAAFYPTPKKLLKNNGWYKWNIKHWGTKWDVKAELMDSTDEYLHYYFESAWSPPILWLK
jgi:hypothetical protein